uniref:Secreted protein n=1 Tax=Panthera tigris altaica TaxID=74533 RepID=A0A8C9M8S1_PANTA
MYLKPSLFLVLYFLSGNCEKPSALPAFLCLWSLSRRRTVFGLPAAVALVCRQPDTQTLDTKRRRAEKVQ